MDYGVIRNTWMLRLRFDPQCLRVELLDWRSWLRGQLEIHGQLLIALWLQHSHGQPELHSLNRS